MAFVNRRSLLVGGAAAFAALATHRPAAAQGQSTAAISARARAFKVGAFKVTTLLSGTAPNDEPQAIFGPSVSRAEFERVSTENFLRTDRLQFYYTPTLVQTGSATILFDTGLSAESLTGPLSDVDVSAGDVTHVVITHMHPDHIGGMTTADAAMAYPNARFLTGAIEFDSNQSRENPIFDAKIRPFSERFTFLNDEDAVAPGVTAMAAFGHTPGHMIYRLESEGQHLLIVADLVGHYVWSFANPDWEMFYDTDKAQASATRRNVLDMLASEKLPMIGYHMPFSAAGFVETRGDGFRFVPVSYQLLG